VLQPDIDTLFPPGRAHGGPVSRGTFLVGERGPELLRLDSGHGFVLPLSRGAGSVVAARADPRNEGRSIVVYTTFNGCSPWCEVGSAGFSRW
jgi:hypothetical protein